MIVASNLQFLTIALVLYHTAPVNAWSVRTTDVAGKCQGSNAHHQSHPEDVRSAQVNHDGAGLTETSPSLAQRADRRSFVSALATVATSASASLLCLGFPQNAIAASASQNRIAERFEKTILTLPPPPATATSAISNGIDNMSFPSWLQGEWDVTQTLVDVQTPLGLKYIGGPNGSESIAQASLQETKQQLQKPILLKLRYISTTFQNENAVSVVEDRLYNTKQRLNSFAGKSVVASVNYSDVRQSNRQSVLKAGGTMEDPLQTTVVSFKGPAAQKVFVTSHGEMQTPTDGRWAGYEVQRSIFALTNQNTVPPITTDTEYIWELERIDAQHVVGKLRIAGYLNANSDTLYFDARNRAVSLQDYTLDMRRIG